ncbi:MAG: ATP-dependent DNA helicase RecQ [Treponema sp.]|nr:ATP-dependent DNA helicase RecQ [Treponema sp.]
MEDVVKVDAGPEIYSGDPIGKLAFDCFGIKYIYPWQRMVISNILEAFEYKKNLELLTDEERDLLDKENSDSFCKGRQIVLLPTGAGKSLCFQIPAMVLDGYTLVIYPLLALMSDQFRRMEQGSLKSVIFKGGQSREERDENFRRLKDGYKMIIANPEVLQSAELVERLKNIGISHVAIDEAHCVSEWGDSFRPSYLGLGDVLKKLNPFVITAFTATASPDVLNRVSEILFDGLAHIVRSESDRQNIHYFLRRACSKKKEALFLAKTEHRPMIIFCGTRNKSEDMARELNVCYGRGTARFYHAGLAKSEKEKIEKWFYESKDGILCATCAYGMGVDKKDIKTVVHLEAPKTVEAYIQEAGRGGRNGSVAKAILLWSLEDSLDFGAYPVTSREYQMKKFAETADFRRQILLDALGGEQAVCSGCDLCNARREKACLQNLKGMKQVFYRRKLEKDMYVADWEMTYSIIKKTKNYYTDLEIEDVVSKKMNERYLSTIGLNIWNHSDSTEVIKQLKESGKISECNFLWKGRLTSKD